MPPHNIIIIGCNVPREWSTDYPYQTAQELSKDNIVICWMLQPISLKDWFVKRPSVKVFFQQKKNLYVYQPVYIIPFRRFAFVNKINMWLSVQVLRLVSRYFLWKKQKENLVLWVFDPRFVPLYRLIWKNTHVIYDCVDYVCGLTTNPQQKQKWKELERSLVERALVVTTNSYALQGLYIPIRHDVTVVPQGFRLDIYSQYRKKVNKEYLLSIPQNQQVIGYIGAINYRLDFGLLQRLIQRNPKWTFVFVGPIQESESKDADRKITAQLRQLLNFPNAHYYPDQKKRLLPSIINQFTIGIIPYDISFPFNRYCFPMKLFEYFYIGKPVVSTPIKELARFSKYVKIGATVEEWEKHFRIFLSKSWSASSRQAQRRLAIANSWEKKITAIIQQMSQ